MVEKLVNNIGEARRSYAATRPDGRFTQEQAANTFGVALSTYRAWEQGVGKGLKGTQLSAIAEFYGCSIDYLLCRTDSPDFKRTIGVTKDERELIEAYRKLDYNSRDAVKQLVAALSPKTESGAGEEIA